MITVSIADDHPLIIHGIQKMLGLYDNITITGMYPDGASLLDGLEQTLPDILLLDIQMPGKNGIELAGIIQKKYPAVKIIALTNVDVPVQVKKMMRTGCMGYLLKNITPQILITAIQTVYNGEQYIYADIEKRLLNHLLAPAATTLITRREKEILQMIAAENTNQEIADQLHLSIYTVINHRNNLLAKLNVKNTAGLVKIAMQEGLI